MKHALLLIISATLVISCTTSSGSLISNILAIEETETDDSETNQETEKKGVEIISYPSGADVYINNIYKGQTPLTIEDLSTAQYKVEIIKQGFHTHTDWLYYNGEFFTYEVTLEPITGFIFISTEPDNTIIILGDNKISAGQNEVPIGTYTLRVRAFGYDDYLATVTINQDQTTYVDVTLTEADFRLYDIQVSRKAFNPRNPGILGIITIDFQVSSPGTGEITIYNSTGESVFSHNYPPFTTWQQSVDWNGKDQNTQILPDGNYRIKITGVTEKDGQHKELETQIRIDSSQVISYRSIWGGSAGLLYCPSPEVIPVDSIQISALSLVHYYIEAGYLRAPTSLGIRYGLYKNLELNISTTAIFENTGNTPYSATLSGKYQLLRAQKPFGFGMAALLKVSYQHDFYLDTYANYTGISAGFPSRFVLGPFCLILSPEIIFSPYRVSYDSLATQQPRAYFWLYGRSGFFLDTGDILAGISVSIRTLPFNQGFAIELPLQGAVEFHYMIPDTSLFLSLAAATEYVSADNLYIMGGGGLGILW